MIRLLDIEFFKLKNSKYFWVLFILFIIFLIAVPVGINLFFDTVKTGQMTAQGKMLVSQVSSFYSSDLWQNLTYIYKLGTLLLSFIVIISITSEYNYKTIKQNIIDGLSKKEFLLSKIFMIFIISILVTISIGLVGIITSYLFSDISSFSQIFEKIHFLAYYFLYVFNFLLFSLFLGLLIKKSGVGIAVMMFYVVMIEPIIVAVTTYGLKIKWLSAFYPMNGPYNLIPSPFSKFLVQDVDNIFNKSLYVTVFYIIFYIYSSYFLLNKRDL